jgi:uncharacterized lipoprotein
MKKMLFIGATALLMFTGCTPKHVINYAPSSVLTVNGNTSIGQFNYLPAKNGNVKMNQIKNTALGSIMFEQNINDVFQKAVFSELRLVGVNVNSNKNILIGNINEFLIDDIGFSIDWTVDVNYIVKRKKSNKVCFNKTKIIHKNTPKFSNPFGALNEVIKLNIEELMKDPNFKKCIR